MKFQIKMNKFFIIYITLLFIDYIKLLKIDNNNSISDVNYELNYSFIQNDTLKIFNSLYYSQIFLKNLTNITYNSTETGSVNITIYYSDKNYKIIFTLNNSNDTLIITPENKILNSKIQTNNNSIILFNNECFNEPYDCNCSNLIYCLNISQNEANILSFYIIHHLFENSGIYGIFIIPIGLFISLYGSIHHIITSIFYGIFFLFSIIQFISEEFNFDLGNDIFIVELVISSIIPGGALGFYLSNSDTKTPEFKREKVLFGSFLGMIIWNSLLYYIYIPLISRNEFNIKLMKYITIIPMIIFSIIYYKIKKNKIYFLINTIIIGSYLTIYGLNLILGGFYYDRIIFHEKFVFYSMETPHLLIYLIINILLLIFSFIYQLNIRYITDKGKNKNKKIRKILSEHSLDHSSSTLNDLNETYKNLSNEEEKEFNGKEEGNLIENINIMNEN